MRSARNAAVVLAAAGVLLGACSSSSSTTTTAVRRTATTSPISTVADYTRYSVPGPFAAGTIQYVVDDDRVQVWYPVARSAVPANAVPYSYRLRSWLPAAIQRIVPATFDDKVAEDAYAGVPVAPGSHPVVLFSHGYGGYPEQSSFLTAHLATWGFVVVAPDETSRDLSAVVLGAKYTLTDRTRDIGQMNAALAFVIGQSRVSATLLFGHVNSNEVGTLGHSAGGYTAIATAEADPSIKTAVALAGVPTAPPTRPLPILLMSGSSDKVVSTKGIQTFYDKILAPKAFVIINGAGHNVFDDVCTIARGQGGVGAATRALKLPVPPALLALASDGCKPPDIYPPKAYGLIDQAVTAEMLYGLGINKSPIGLGPGLDHAFAGVVATYQGNPAAAG